MKDLYSLDYGSRTVVIAADDVAHAFELVDTLTLGDLIEQGLLFSVSATNQWVAND